MHPSTHSCELRPRRDKRGVDLISDALPFGRLWYTKPDDAVDYAKFFSRSYRAVIRVYDEAGNVIQTHEHEGDFKEPSGRFFVDILPQGSPRAAFASGQRSQTVQRGTP